MVSAMDTLLRKKLPQYIFTATETIKIQLLSIQWLSFLVSIMDSILSVYFRAACRLSPRTLRLDGGRTTMLFWAPRKPDPEKPNLLMIHGYGADSKWQFAYQMGRLARSFNIYAPDLVFFGGSFSTRSDRSAEFQAECVARGMEEGFGVARYSVYSISYGGYVAYSMAGMFPDKVEKMVIVSSGIVWTADQKAEQMGKLGKDVVDLLLPQNVEDLRMLLNLSIHKSDMLKMCPDILLQGFIKSMGEINRKEKKELMEDLMGKKAYGNHVPVISQETLLVWGDSDRVFPLFFGQQLLRHLGEKAKLKVLKDTGHAANMESANLLNDSIIDFIIFNSAQNVYSFTK